MTLCPNPQIARRPAVSGLGDSRMVSASPVPTGLSPNPPKEGVVSALKRQEGAPVLLG